MEFFTVSFQEFPIGKTINLMTDLPSLNGFPGLFTTDEVKELVDRLYPNGVSNFGAIFLHSHHAILKDTNGRDLMHLSPIIDTIVELVRLWQFPDKPSRLISAFGWSTLEEAEKFKAERRIGNRIYKVSTDNYFSADMNLLRAGSTIASNILLAEKYWQGKSSQNPCWEVLMGLPFSIVEII